MLLAVYTTLKQANPSAVSQAQGYPPPETTPPGEQNNSGYPGPEFVVTTPVPTSPLPIFTPSSALYFPFFNRHLPAKKGMVWHYYPLTNVDPWNAMNIGWFYRYAPSNGTLTNVHGPIEYIPFWTCSWHDVDWMLTQVPTGYDGYFMWINEPNTGPQFPGGCHELTDWNLAADFYIQSRDAYPNAKFIGPHTYHGSQAAHLQAMNWVTQWRTAVKNHPDGNGQYPDVTGYGIHPYDTDRERNLRYVEEYYAMMVSWGEGDKELWVTEFAYCIPSTLALDIQYTVSGLENRPYVDRYAYWVDYRETPVPPSPTPTPGANDNDMDVEPQTVPLGWCVDPENTISLFDPNVGGYNTLSAAGEIYSQVGR